MRSTASERGALTGWGRTAPSVASTVAPAVEDLPALVRGAGERGLIARGLGRSYGDPAQNAGGLVVFPLPGWVRPEPEAPGGPVVHVSAGTSLHELIRRLLPLGLFVPVTPGTRYVTVGGAIAADVHGKNHHRAGSIGDHVVSLDLVVADGSTLTVGPDRDPELFWATVGGMGLTGVITSATLRLPAISSGYLRVRTERLTDLPSLMARMREADRDATYSVAWIDTMSGGRQRGRSILTLGEHAVTDELPAALRARRWALPGSPRVSFPSSPASLVTRLSTSAFGEFWYRRAPREPREDYQGIAEFFHPLDGVGRWNRAYGARGLLQYQFVVPDAAEAALPELFDRVLALRVPSFLSVLKRFGPAGPGLLSFPMRGWTLAVDMPADPGLAAALDDLDRRVVDAGGRVYLAKDSRLTPAVVERMYPRLEEFLGIKARVDPAGVFRSDLSRRLRITK